MSLVRGFRGSGLLADLMFRARRSERANLPVEQHRHETGRAYAESVCFQRYGLQG